MKGWSYNPLILSTSTMDIPVPPPSLHVQTSFPGSFPPKIFRVREPEQTWIQNNLKVSRRSWGDHFRVWREVMEVWFKWFSCSKGWLFGSCYFSEKYELKWGKKQRCRHWSTQILQFCPWHVVIFYNEKDLQRSQTNRVLIVCMAQTWTRQTSLQVILELQRSTVNCLRRNSSDTIFHPGYWSNTWGLCNPVISWQGL